MDATAYQEKAKRLLKGIVKQRDFLMKHDNSYLESNWCRTEMENLKYALPRLVDAHKTRGYILRKETTLRYLIPPKNLKRQEELRELIQEPIN